MPKRTPYLVIKNGRHYFRLRIPDDLQQTFGKKEHTEALGDINRAQADVRAAQLGAHWQAKFLEERHRQGRALSPPAPSPETVRTYRPATLDEVKAVAAAVAHRMLDEDEELRIEGLPWWRDLEESPEFGMGQPFGTVVADAVAGRNLAGLKERAEESLSVHGLDLPEDEAEQRRALYAWGQAMAKTLAGRKKRDQGEVVETPAKPEPPRQSCKALALT